MILIDYNQMIIANFMQFRKQFEPGKEDAVMRHMVLMVCYGCLVINRIGVI